jgi:hypothetical protein
MQPADRSSPIDSLASSQIMPKSMCIYFFSESVHTSSFFNDIYSYPVDLYIPYVLFHLKMKCIVHDNICNQPLFKNLSIYSFVSCAVYVLIRCVKKQYIPYSK